jgi:hypothetical protein
MAESGGEGNIKVVVRCRPLNSRGPYLLISPGNPGLARLFSSYGNPYDVPVSDIMQSWVVARSLSSGCREIKRSSALQNQVLGKLRLPPVVQASAKLTPSRSIRVTGRLGRGTNLDIVRKKHCITIWALNCWSMGSRDLTRVFWPVSNRVFLPQLCVG